ncbi:polyprenyl synthetase family protein [Gemella haemolysans]|uniref:Farnesyl diphosphate synthase n=1 Tax=Gemella haemolysans ATCC 10379 TaxID=546270 RepID=C5NYL0_9BACL|nr:polyprenyl synthetase family protein [Gemella haemolysans]EER67570.1 polyprenyl synthetase [Gemella haemolysans ATCC 10379]KAA8709356.1 polyprenyl synthetase family protein [Gemella haemolysans]UBH83057.1 polyprenyl synthetase family protein [Gemella haemolysans]VEI38673.1 Farnesyl diphosphate synthase [Gemella haemolysans]
MNNFKLFIETNKDKLNAFAKDYVEKLEMPDILKESITYSLVNDGKKIRPLSFLYLLKFYGIEYSKYFDIALAIELVHTYSLVHDDLPEMDNDDYRWGKYTNHKVYGQDVAVLTGDAMLTLAFEVLSDADVKPDLKVRLIKQFANYSGAMGMIAGQIYDVKQKNYDVDADYLRKMHSLKTGRLIELPLDFACLVANKLEDYDDVKEFGQQLGIAYQIKDDILDYYGDFEKIGKLPSDEDMITYLSFYGIEECEELLKQHTFNAITVAKRLNNNLLEDFANYLLKRDK